MPFFSQKWTAANFIVAFFDSCGVIRACSRAYTPFGDLSKNTFARTFSKTILSRCLVFRLLPLSFGNSAGDVVAARAWTHVSFFVFEPLALVVYPSIPRF